MKVAINKCFGGFGLSPRGVARFSELKGRPCYFFVRDIAKGGIHAKAEPATVEQATEAFMFFAYDVPNPDEVLPSSDDFHEKTLEERKAINAAYENHSIQTGREIDRADPDLIRTIEELGESANGRHAKIAIIEIPDGTDYTIEEYDGREHIAEVHRTWH